MSSDDEEKEKIVSKLKKEGNYEFIHKNYKKSIEFYTKVCFIFF